MGLCHGEDLMFSDISVWYGSCVIGSSANLRRRPKRCQLNPRHSLICMDASITAIVTPRPLTLSCNLSTEVGTVATLVRELLFASEDHRAQRVCACVLLRQLRRRSRHDIQVCGNLHGKSKCLQAEGCKDDSKYHAHSSHRVSTEEYPSS